MDIETIKELRRELNKKIDFITDKYGALMFSRLEINNMIENIIALEKEKQKTNTNKP